MKKHIYLLVGLVSAILTNTVVHATDLFRLDGIKAIVHTEGDTHIITESDLTRLGLGGETKSIEEEIFKEIAYERAKQRKMLPDEEAIDKHLKTVQRENNLTQEQLKAIFSSAGYTYEEGRNEFAVMTAVNSLLEFEIRSRLMVPEREVLAYYTAHPERRPASYYLERTVVAVPEDVTKEEFKEQLAEFTRTKKGFKDIVWSNPFWVLHPDLAEDKMFIATMKVGEISRPIEIEGGFELFRLKNAKPEHDAPLEERYQEIAAILRKPRYEALMKEYRKNLFDSASIIYF